MNLACLMHLLKCDWAGVHMWALIQVEWEQIVKQDHKTKKVNIGRINTDTHVAT